MERYQWQIPKKQLLVIMHLLSRTKNFYKTLLMTNILHALLNIPSRALNYTGYISCRLMITQASSIEPELRNKSLTRIIEAMNEDPISNKEVCCISIENLCKSGDLSDAALLLRVLKSKNIHANVSTFKTLLKASSNANKFQLSSQVFKDLYVIDKSLDSSTFTLIARSFNQTNINPVLELIQEISALTFPSGCSIFVNRLIIGFFESGQADKALLLFEEMKHLQCKPDIVTFNSILLVLGNTRDITRMIGEFCSMKVSGLIPDIITYNTLINCFRKMGRLDLCLIFFKDMLVRGIEPDLRTYTALIDIFGRRGNIDDALKLFEEMRKRKIRSSIYVYRSLVSNLKRSLRLEMAEIFLEEFNSCASNLIGPKDFKSRDRKKKST